MAKFQRYVWSDAAAQRHRNRAKYEHERKEMEKRVAGEKRWVRLFTTKIN